MVQHISFFELLDLVEVMKTCLKKLLLIIVTIYDIKFNRAMKNFFDMKALVNLKSTWWGLQV